MREVGPPEEAFRVVRAVVLLTGLFASLVVWIDLIGIIANQIAKSIFHAVLF